MTICNTNKCYFFLSTRFMDYWKITNKFLKTSIDKKEILPDMTSLFSISRHSSAFATRLTWHFSIMSYKPGLSWIMLINSSSLASFQTAIPFFKIFTYQNEKCKQIRWAFFVFPLDFVVYLLRHFWGFFLAHWFTSWTANQNDQMARLTDELRRWFNMSNRPKTSRRGPTSADGVEHTEKT